MFTVRKQPVSFTIKTLKPVNKVLDGHQHYADMILSIVSDQIDWNLSTFAMILSIIIYYKREPEFPKANANLRYLYEINV